MGQCLETLPSIGDVEFFENLSILVSDAHSVFSVSEVDADYRLTVLSIILHKAANILKPLARPQLPSHSI